MSDSVVCTVTNVFLEMAQQKQLLCRERFETKINITSIILGKLLQFDHAIGIPNSPVSDVPQDC